eukprot:scaffold3161_cov247-Ochromonas_danica.AAC.1
MAGRVRIFSYLLGSGWAQMGREIVGVQATENLGMSIALNGDGKRIVIGSSGYDVTVSSGGLINDAGRVCVYSYNRGYGWTLLGNQIFGTQQTGGFGMSVSISKDGNMIAAGCPNYYFVPSNAASIVDLVQAYLYSASTTGWIQVADDVKGVQIGENCGSVVSLSGSGGVLGVGCPYYDPSSSLSDVGRLRMYVSNTTIPSSRPSRQPTSQPSNQPSRQPTTQPTSQPSYQPTSQPSNQPSNQPTSQASSQPTSQPSSHP